MALSFNRDGFISDIESIIDKHIHKISGTQYIDSNIIRAISEELEQIQAKIHNLYNKEEMSDEVELTTFDVIISFESSINAELRAVVEETENCANTILDASEAINGLIMESDNEEFRDNGINLLTNLFEACNFQDLVFQRVQKVNHIILDAESKMLKMFNDHKQVKMDFQEILKNIATLSEQTQNIIDEQTHNYDASVEINDSALKNGPQVDAPSQNEIDDLFDSL